MSFMIVAGGIALAAFLLSYIKAGRFGSTVLALGVGYVFALLWADTLASYRGVSLPFISWQQAVYIGLIVFPGLLALFFSHKQKSLLPRLVASLAVALLVVALLFPIFEDEARSHVVYEIIKQYREAIMSALLGLGLLDMVFSRLPKAPKHSKD